MTLLDGDALRARRVVAGGALQPLAASLREDLAPLLASPAITPPAEKARLTRIGGRCPQHGVLLEFDPFSPRSHRCPTCGVTWSDEEHYRWWVMNRQLWLAERAVHAASLAVTTSDQACERVAVDILSACAHAYLAYPNRDNVLGPSRPFFSTYLESIWTLQLGTALSLLEAGGCRAPGDDVRALLLEPSAALIAEYDEGMSNRQVWNNAALLLCGHLLDKGALVSRAVEGRSGLLAHLRDGLLADGSWYEGENYHQFAHRGLWYGVVLAERLALLLPAPLVARFEAAFALPFATALPDFTFPARRDSQYGVSLRQWRYAESCELGLARGDAPALRAALQVLYGDDLPAGDTGRAISTGEAERNVPGTRLTRASLGWKSLLFARPGLPPLDVAATAPRSVHLESQGLAIFRRRQGRVYAALDYGTPGGGHGHPDRLNLWLVDGPVRWLEDVGTGSYVERALFWYRSTLAHNAPLVNGGSQPYGAGVLRAWDEQGGAGWVEAEFDIVPGRSRVVRRLVVMEDYVIDEVSWASADPVTLDLPMHLDPDDGPGTGFAPAALPGAEGTGFEFLRNVRAAAGAPFDAFTATRDGHDLHAWVQCDVPYTWYSAEAPGAPGQGFARFLFARVAAREGRLRSVWAWGGAVSRVRFTSGTVAIDLADGGRHAHREIRGEWHVRTADGVETAERVLAGRVEPGAAWAPAPEAIDTRPHHMLAAGRPFAMELGERHYRRSELPWAEAGAPQATLRVAAGREVVDIEVHVRKADPVFAPASGENPLDNEVPDINSDGVQLYLDLPDAHAHGSWILVPEADGRVRVTVREAQGSVPPLAADWRLTSDGYRVRCHLPRGPRGLGIDRHFMLNVVVNEISRDRERRRGQLVATGAAGEWVYLRGDREDPRRMLAFEVVDA